MSLRGRLVLLAASAVALAICAAAITSYVVVRSELRGQVDDVLTNAAARFNEFLTGPKGGPGVGSVTTFRGLKHADRTKELKRVRLKPPKGEPGPPGPPGESDILIVHLNRHGNVGGPEPAGASQFPKPTAAERRIARTGEGRELVDRDIDGEHFRVLTEPIDHHGAVILARSLQGVDDVLARLRVILAVVAATGVALAAVLAWLVSRQAMAPIRRLTATAEHVGATEDLSQRIEVGRGDEVGRLAVRFNEMLDTLQASRAELAGSVEAQRQLVADASHELRTPVASLRTDIEVLLEHPEMPQAERARLLGTARDRSEELGRLIGDVIELARGDEPVAARDEVRLDRLAAEAVERARRLAPERRFETDLQPAVVAGDAERLARAVNNLLDNACKYSPDSESVEVRVGGEGLVVRDHGPGIPPAEAEHIFDRFHRGASTRDAPGSGLGLAIVRQVAEAHGGRVSVEQAPGGGALFRLALPGE
jgi:two-component system sensor histidine kinase MprB